MATATAAAPALASGLASKLAAVSNGVSGSPCIVAVPNPGYSAARKDGQGMKVVAQAAAAPERVPDMGKRNLMNLLLLGAISLPTAGLLGPYLYFLVPPGSGGSGLGVTAKDALGNDITMSGWLKTHQPGDRTLAQGLKGDPTYLVVENDGTLATYGVNAVCTHLGCVVPWNKAENKFMCPCHGSQYNNQGKVVRGPAPLSLALAHVDVTDDKVVFSQWAETDFRTGEDPWWS
jgi:cytochrome b6-f complex iron-sulfur subunit